MPTTTTIPAIARGATTAITAATEGAATASGGLSAHAGRLSHEVAGGYVGELFAEHGRMVLGLCRLLLRDPIEAEDAAQQVFLSAHHSVLRGSVPREGRAWLAAIARNECRARIRARMREPLTLPELPSDRADPLVAAIRAADLDAVWAALGTLPRRQRRALVLRELGGLSYHELGLALGVSHSAVESLLFRARRRVGALVAGANAAAAPAALRDQLTQVIPGFDPGSAGVVARIAALPLAFKLAGAVVGVGVVATGVGEVHRGTGVVPHARNAVQRPAFVPPLAPRPVRVRLERVARATRAASATKVERRRRGRRSHEVEAERREPLAEPEAGPGGAGEPVAKSSSEERGPPPVTTAAEVGSGNDGPGGGEAVVQPAGDQDHGSGTDGSGSDGGSGRSGPG